MKKKNLLIIMLLLSLIVIMLGVSVAIFFYLGKGTTNNVIQTGRIVFSYSDAEPGNTGNSINITDALPIPDSEGKRLSKPNEYFDFSVSASTTYTDLAYEIVALKQPNSTIDEDRIKIYLTEFNGNSEIETPITGGTVTPSYKSLKDTNNSLLEGKSIYYGNVIGGEVAYGKRFRLRMWLGQSNRALDDPNILDDGEFTVRVNVAAVGNN